MFHFAGLLYERHTHFLSAPTPGHPTAYTPTAADGDFFSSPSPDRDFFSDFASLAFKQRHVRRHTTSASTFD